VAHPHPLGWLAKLGQTLGSAHAPPTVPSVVVVVEGPLAWGSPLPMPRSVCCSHKVSIMPKLSLGSLETHTQNSWAQPNVADNFDGKFAFPIDSSEQCHSMNFSPKDDKV